MTTTPETIAAKESLRGAIFDNKNRKRKHEDITMFGQTVEVRQPTLGQISKLADNTDKVPAIFRIMIQYCYVPGTDDKVFTNADIDALSELPTGKWLTDFNAAIEKMTGIDVRGAEKNSEETPSD